MINIKGKNYNTVSDAAKYFGVSVKTVRDYIKRGIIPEPPKISQGLREIDIYPDEYIKQAQSVINNKNDEAFNNLSLNQVMDKKVYITAQDLETKKILRHELFINKIPFDDYFNPRDYNTSYRISEKAFKYLKQKGLKIEIIKVENIGELSLEERNKIKRYHRQRMKAEREELLRELREKYGTLK
ncbi:MAG: helix-turn-helix domain-containing protein [Candidatus Glassbacteria bacterium]